MTGALVFIQCFTKCCLQVYLASRALCCTVLVGTLKFSTKTLLELTVEPLKRI